MFFLAITLQSGFSSAADVDIRVLLEGAIKDLSSGKERGESENFQQLLSHLPKVPDGRYVVEGDLLLTERELEDRLLDLAPGTQSSEDNVELKVNKHNGIRDIYETIAERTLTYAIRKNSFGSEQQYAEMIALMSEATGNWEAICPSCRIDFVHKQSMDLNPNHRDVNFIVELRDAGGFFIANAFFPHDTGSNRVLTVDPSFYTSEFAKRGILEHELGHVLGYAHEQIQGIPGCRPELGTWMALTDYDNKSIMHYFCGGGGSLDMKISDTDKVGHRLIYQ
ncbi:hypothetical protein VP03_29390 [Sinorhizobium meliloti]|nr:hypothetical protein VP03_29390 [Sinorhizobium meliloti]